MSHKDKNLEDFVGKEFDLTAADTSSMTVSKYGSDENASFIAFTLDGVTWMAQEDPSDGYRSSLDSIVQVPAALVNTFPPCRVRAEWEANEEHCQNEIVVFRSVETGLPVLEVGTANTDDYYPSFVGNFMPQNMDINSPHVQNSRALAEQHKARMEAEREEQRKLEQALDQIGWGSF